MLALLASFASVMNTILYILLAIVVLLIMITIHEFGHYIVGKKLGFKINEFAIGFGKAIFKKTLKSGEIFSIRILPLGGYCAFAGEDEDDPDPAAFNNQKPWKRMIVQFAGVLFNFLSAIIFAFILLVGFGYDVRKVDSVDPMHVQQMNEMGYTRVLHEGDIIREVNGVKVSFTSGNTFNRLMEDIGVNEEFTYTVEHSDGSTEVLTLQKFANPSVENDTTGMLGVTLGYYQYTFLEAIANCVPVAAVMAWEILVFLFQLLTGAVDLSQVGGPITTIGTMAEYTQINIMNLFIFLPFISVNLAVFNLLPIPALDGSRMIFTGIEWIRGKPVNRKVEAWIHFGGLVVLFAFVIFIDLFNLFT
ncbi:MAG: site-2 protease family protein [Clostridia bacterium]|nr:site-2 protease family protein [Clostridia bacterium]